MAFPEETPIIRVKSIREFERNLDKSSLTKTQQKHYDRLIKEGKLIPR